MTIKSLPMPSYPPGTVVRLVGSPRVTGVVYIQEELSELSRRIGVRLHDGGSAWGLTNLWEPAGPEQVAA